MGEKKAIECTRKMNPHVLTGIKNMFKQNPCEAHALGYPFRY